MTPFVPSELPSLGQAGGRAGTWPLLRRKQQAA